ncbi:MAG: urease accessory protein UreD [Ruminococcus flavefaciens]|nr:urease accessory protein UreD [Ruminococcus flavefaciens]MCM1230780.1 urease accessory protein UreD [Ruminococcus flavefaciens]
MSRLYLKTEFKNNRTIISDSFFTSPLKIAKPFYHKNFTEIMMMTASAGILENDFYDIEIDVAKNSKLKFSGQSYTKIFTSVEKGAVQEVKINVGKNAEFVYLPMPVIPFKNSIFRSNTEIHLDESSKFAMLDIVSCGRMAMGEIFAFKSYTSRITVYMGKKPVFLDNQRLVPRETDLSCIGFFENHTHIGMLYLYGYDIENLPENNNIECGFSKVFCGTCIRISGNSGDDILRFANKIIENI